MAVGPHTTQPQVGRLVTHSGTSRRWIVMHHQCFFVGCKPARQSIMRCRTAEAANRDLHPNRCGILLAVIVKTIASRSLNPTYIHLSAWTWRRQAGRGETVHRQAVRGTTKSPRLPPWVVETACQLSTIPTRSTSPSRARKSMRGGRWTASNGVPTTPRERASRS